MAGFGSFYFVAPPDNAATIAIGAAVDFPQDGPDDDGNPLTGIRRAGVDSFILPDIGTYEISYQVSIAEAGKLILTLDSGGGPVELANTVAGRATGTTQIVNTVLITTTVVDSVLTVSNPLSAASALTVTLLAGGAEPVSGWLVISQLVLKNDPRGAREYLEGGSSQPARSKTRVRACGKKGKGKRVKR